MESLDEFAKLLRRLRVYISIKLQNFIVLIFCTGTIPFSIVFTLCWFVSMNKA